MVYILAAIFFYSCAILLSTKASRSGDSSFVTTIINLVSFVLPLVIIAPSVSRQFLADNKLALIWAVATGFAIAIFTLFINKAFQVEKVGIVSPMVFGGAIAISSLGSYLIFGDKLNLVQLIGLGLVVVGVLVIAWSKATATS